MCKKNHEGNNVKNISLRNTVFSVIGLGFVIAATFATIRYYPFDLPPIAKLTHISLIFFIGCISSITMLVSVIYSAIMLITKAKENKIDRKRSNSNT